MARLLSIAVLTAALAYAGLCLLMFVAQRELMYFPTRAAPFAPGTVLELPTEVGVVHVSQRPRPGPKALIYFGGNAEDVRFSLPDLAKAFDDHAIYLMHYRGYGGSAGSPSEAALVADALALFDRVRREHAEIVVVGRSLGSGVALQLARQRPVSRLVLVTPYDSMLRLAQHHYPWLPVAWLLHDRFESWRHAPAIPVPTRIIAAEHDEVIPRAHTDALLPHFRPGTATMTVLAGTGHNTISEHRDYGTELRGVR